MPSERQNDPAADPLVARAAWVLCESAGHDPEALDEDGEPMWRRYIEMGISAIATNEKLFGGG